MESKLTAPPAHATDSSTLYSVSCAESVLIRSPFLMISDNEQPYY